MLGLYTFCLIFSKWASGYVLISWTMISLLSMTVLSYKYLNKRVLDCTAAVGALYIASSSVALAGYPLFEELHWTYSLAVIGAIGLFFAGRHLQIKLNPEIEDKKYLKL